MAASRRPSLQLFTTTDFAKRARRFTLADSFAKIEAPTARMSAKQSDREYQKSKKDRQYDRWDKPVSQPTLTVVFHLVTFQEDASFVPSFCLGLIAASFALSLVK
jgi:hypothetical protein